MTSAGFTCIIGFGLFLWYRLMKPASPKQRERLVKLASPNRRNGFTCINGFSYTMTASPSCKNGFNPPLVTEAGPV